MNWRGYGPANSGELHGNDILERQLSSRAESLVDGPQMSMK